MASNQLPISNIVNISAAANQLGVGSYNTSNLALFTDEVPLASVETLVFSAVAASGTFILTLAGHATSAINWNDTASVIQGKINALTGQANIVVSGSIASKTLTLQQPGEFGAIPLGVISSNSVQDAGSAAITITPTVTVSGWSGGALGYANYLTPTQVGVDFGTSSKTFIMANAVFSQQPNILAGGGQLVVILMNTAIQNLALSGVAASGTFEVVSANGTTAAINWDDSPAQIQTKIQTVTGQSNWVVTGTIASKTLNIQSYGTYGAVAAFTIAANSLQTAGAAGITFVVTTTSAGETIGAAISRTSNVVQYFGIMANETCAVIGATDLAAAAAVIQPLNKIGFFVSYTSADIQTNGMLLALLTGGFSQTRGLYYGDSSLSGLNALIFMASYAGFALSTDFSGSNTTTTMNLKSLVGVQPDPTMTETLYNTASAARADVYVSFQGVPKIASFNGNGVGYYFDEVYNLQWFIGALQVAGFNYLATTNTKIPQTESGMDGLKGAYRAICNQAVTNGYVAPGVWNSATTFGNQANLILNVGQVGYYIFSLPIAQQTQANRVARAAPLVQIAVKEAGAVHTSTVIVNVNA